MTTTSPAARRHIELMGKIEKLEAAFLSLQEALIGTPSSAGYFERVRDLEKLANSQKRVYWIMGAIILGDILARILSS